MASRRRDRGGSNTCGSHEIPARSGLDRCSSRQQQRQQILASCSAVPQQQPRAASNSAADSNPLVWARISSHQLAALSSARTQPRRLKQQPKHPWRPHGVGAANLQPQWSRVWAPPFKILHTRTTMAMGRALCMLRGMGLDTYRSRKTLCP